MSVPGSKFVSMCTYQLLNCSELTWKVETDAPQQLVRLCTWYLPVLMALDLPLVFTVVHERVRGHMCHLM